MELWAGGFGSRSGQIGRDFGGESAWIQRTFPTGFPRGERVLGVAEKSLVEVSLDSRLTQTENRMKLGV